MPDRYDPKLSVRPNDRKTPDGRGAQGPGGEDPLVELARLVSGRSPFDNAAARPEKAAPSVAAPQPLPSEAELARDLEAELLNELQASFATIPDVVGRSAPPPEPAPTPPPPVAVHPKAQPAAPPPPLTFETSDLLSASEAELSFRPPTGAATEAPARQPLAPAPARVEPQIRPPQGAVKRESLASRIARAAHGGEPTEPTPVRPEPPGPPKALVPQPPRSNAFKPPSPPGRGDPAAAQFRPTLAPNPPAEAVEPPPRSAVTRWDPAPEPARQPPLDLARFAPVAVDPPQRRDPPAARGASAGPEELPGAAALPTVDEAFFNEEPDSEDFDMVPGYGDEELVPYPEDDLSAYEPRRSRRGPLAIAALLTIAVIGGAAVVMLRSGGTDETPPIITADSSPTKVEPDNTGAGDSEGQAKLIYDRVDPGSDVAGSELVVPGGDPIADIPPIPEDTGGNDVSRVILEGGPGLDTPAGDVDPSAPIDLSEGMETTVPGSAGSEPIGPKKVRTVVVRPDGTIVSSTATPSDAAAETIPDLPPPSETPPAAAADENPLLADDFGVEPIDNPTPDTPAGDVASASVPDVPAPAPPPPAPAPAPPPAAKASPPPAPPTVVATTGSANGPIDLTPGKPASAPRIPAGSGGGFLVQVSSQRSQETALSTFRDLQRRYPSILGDREPNIQRADLGERGVYYRVRVGYPTRDEAVRMCENLKSAGGDCILATR